MKKTTLTLLTLCSIFTAQAQLFHVTIKDTVRLNVQPVHASLLPGLNDITVTDDKFVNNIMDKFDYVDEFFEGHKTTLYIYKGADSVLKSESADNCFEFAKAGSNWRVKNFRITTTNISLNHVACGLTSKQVFKLLNKKIKKPIGNGRVWLSNNNGSYRFLLVFSEDKLVSMFL